MHITLCPDAETLGFHAAEETAAILREAIAGDGVARMILSTGASQFTTLDALVQQPDIDWNKVEMFHLDEYVGIPQTHPASFRKYLKERFVEKTNVGKAFFVSDSPDCIRTLTLELNRAPVHVGLIGIGQNAHIAFNDPPMDLGIKDSYIIVTLDEKCKNQQVSEGWFPTTNDVPKQAITMTPYQIMKCERIISAVPYDVKADAIQKTLRNSLTDMIPSTVLKTHPQFSLYVDHASFGKTTLTDIVTASVCKAFDIRVYTAQGNETRYGRGIAIAGCFPD